jgi:hypothetical protein
MTQRPDHRRTCVGTTQLLSHKGQSLVRSHTDSITRLSDSRHPT